MVNSVCKMTSSKVQKVSPCRNFCKVASEAERRGRMNRETKSLTKSDFPSCFGNWVGANNPTQTSVSEI